MSIATMNSRTFARDAEGRVIITEGVKPALMVLSIEANYGLA